jgi:hypothetical protein
MQTVLYVLEHGFTAEWLAQFFLTREVPGSYLCLEIDFADGEDERLLGYSAV